MSQRTNNPEYNGESFTVFCENNCIENRDISAVELFTGALVAFRNSLGITKRIQHIDLHESEKS